MSLLFFIIFIIIVYTHRKNIIHIKDKTKQIGNLEFEVVWNDLQGCEKFD